MVAEQFRDRGKKVLLIIDSVTGIAQAHRQFASSQGEALGRDGYPPSFFRHLANLFERAGRFGDGSITAFYTCLTHEGDGADAIREQLRSRLDGSIVLSRDLARKRHYPAISVLDSLSKMMSDIVSYKHLKAALRAREILATYERHFDAISNGT
jgi:flagellum-specific ATP synthase